jgi:hypothetical protein
VTGLYASMAQLGNKMLSSALFAWNEGMDTMCTAASLNRMGAPFINMVIYHLYCDSEKDWKFGLCSTQVLYAHEILCNHQHSAHVC